MIGRETASDFGNFLFGSQKKRMPVPENNQAPVLPTAAPCYVIYPMPQGMHPMREDNQDRRHQDRLQKWGRQSMLKLLDEVIREQVIPELLSELDWQGKDVQEGGILPRATMHKKPVAMTLMMELVSRVVHEESTALVHTSIREMIDDFVQLDIAQSVLDDMMMELLHEHAPTFIMESQREVLAEQMMHEMIDETTASQTLTVVQDMLRWQKEQKRIAIKEADIQLAHGLAEDMLDRMIVESMLSVVREKSPRLICDSLAEHLLHRWIMESFMAMCMRKESHE